MMSHRDYTLRKIEQVLDFEADGVPELYRYCQQLLEELELYEEIIEKNIRVYMTSTEPPPPVYLRVIK